MKQLTRNEVVELRARAIAKTFYHSAGDFESIKDDFDTDEIYANECWDLWEAEAIATIEADEKAGVLQLIEDGNKTPAEWQRITGITILDPDGWRTDNKAFDEPISRFEWDERMSVSTIQGNMMRYANMAVYQCAKDKE